MKHYVGLDVSMQKTFVCILDENGKILHEDCIKTDPTLIADFLDDMKLKDIVLGFESGSLSHYLMNGFKERNIRAICMDARKLNPILNLKVNKTDKNDARGIAEALRANLYTEIVCKPKESIDKAVLLGARRTLINQQTQLKNSVRGLLKSYGVRLGSVSVKNFSFTAMKNIEKYPDIVVKSIRGLLDIFDHLSEEIKKFDRKVLETISQDKQVKRFMTIPGIGPITALTYKIEIFDPRRFKKAKSVGAYLGMTPTQYVSGEIQRQGRISKRGSMELRSLLVEAGMCVLMNCKKWSKLKAWGLKILRKKGIKKAALAVGRKLAIIMHKMMLEEKDFIYGEPKKA